MEPLRVMVLVTALPLNELYNCVKFEVDTINSSRDMLRTKFVTHGQTDDGEVIPICRGYFVAGDTKTILLYIVGCHQIKNNDQFSDSPLTNLKGLMH